MRELRGQKSKSKNTLPTAVLDNYVPQKTLIDIAKEEEDGNENLESATSEIERLKRELQYRESEILALKENRNSKQPRTRLAIRNNIEKIIAAITAESKIQGTDSPCIGFKKLKTVYKINQNYYEETIKYAEENGIFTREAVEYSKGVKTYRWCIPKSH